MKTSRLIHRPSRVSIGAAIVALSLVASACGGGSKKTATGTSGGGNNSVVALPGASTPGGSSTSIQGAAQAPGTGTGGGAAPSGGGGTGPAAGPVNLTNNPGAAAGTPPPPATTPSFKYTPANVYSNTAATQGITSSQITLCMHAATVLGSVFNERPQDIGVYWQWLNAHGGVIGRKVNLSIQDDAYTPQGAQQAAQQCEATNPFLVIGGIGFDQDPVVRQIAEQDHFIYIYTMADRGSGKYTYSFTGAPTIQQEGTWMAQAVLTNKYPGPYGAVYVNDSAWIGGWTTFKSWMDAHGGGSVDKNAYTTNSGGDTSGFQAYITQLKIAGVKTVYLWMNALAVDAFVEQAANQGYFPAIATPDGFNLVTQTVGSDIDNKSPAPKPAIAAWVTPAFDPANKNVAWWDSENQMLQAYAQFDPGHAPDDIDWMAWLGFKQISDLLTICGQNCNRNDVIGIFRSGWQGQDYPLCPVDFHADANFGGHSVNLYVAYRENNATVWRQPVTCASSF